MCLFDSIIMSLKRKRTDLPFPQNMRSLNLILEQKMTQSERGRRHLRGLVQSSLSTIFKNHTKIKEDYKSCCNPGRKRKRSGKNSQLDGALKGWFRTARQRDKPVPISCPILQEKASDYAKQINVSDFNASNGWLRRFKTRENIAFKKLQGEKKDADTDDFRCSARDNPSV